MGAPTEAANYMAESTDGLEGRIEGGTANGVIDAVETAPSGEAQDIIRNRFGPLNEGRAKALDDSAAMRGSGRENRCPEGACELERDMTDATGAALDQDGVARTNGHTVNHAPHAVMTTEGSAAASCIERFAGFTARRSASTAAYSASVPCSPPTPPAML